MTDEAAADDRPRDPRGRVVPAAVFAPNWWVVLAVDALMGVAVATAGVVIAVVWIRWMGVAVLSLGVLYVLLVARRSLQWRWLRREAGPR